MSNQPQPKFDPHPQMGEMLTLLNPSGELEVIYSALPKQLEFHQSPAPYRLHVGGYGSGKTLNLLMEAIITCVMVPGCNCLILRTTSPDIQKTVINKFLDPKLVPRWD